MKLEGADIRDTVAPNPDRLPPARSATVGPFEGPSAAHNRVHLAAGKLPVGVPDSANIGVAITSLGKEQHNTDNNSEATAAEHGHQNPPDSTLQPAYHIADAAAQRAQPRRVKDVARVSGTDNAHRRWLQRLGHVAG